MGSRISARAAIALVSGYALLGGTALLADDATPLPTMRQSYAEFGVLETRLRHLRRPSCWTLVVRGTLTNPYDEPVEGARLVVRLLTTGEGEGSREVERLETELTRDIAAKGEAPFNRELTTACTSVFTNLSVVAFAVRRGGAELPVPSAEVEVAAAKKEEGSHLGAGFAPMPNVGGWNPDFTGR